jgi:hypothetical protein
VPLDAVICNPVRFPEFLGRSILKCVDQSVLCGMMFPDHQWSTLADRRGAAEAQQYER